MDGEKAKDHDLVFADFGSLFQLFRTPRQDECFKRTLEGISRVYSFALVRAVILPRTADGRPYLTRGWPTMESMFATYCSRSFFAHGKGFEDVEAIVRESRDPCRLLAFLQIMECCTFINCQW